MGTPLSIPNREVKHFSVDGTRTSSPGRVERRQHKAIFLYLKIVPKNYIPRLNINSNIIEQLEVKKHLKIVIKPQFQYYLHLRGCTESYAILK